MHSNYLYWYELFTNKAKGYQLTACRNAIEDCHRTLEVVCPGNARYESAYATKIWAEIDAMRERIAQLSRKPRQRN